MNIDKLKPTKFLNISTRDFPHCGDLSKPFFVVVGCSHTAGDCIEYKDCWANQLATMLEMEHLNIGFSGSDLSYQSSKIDMLKDTLPEAQFYIWMQTYPVRNRKNFKLLGDTYRRIQVYTTWEDPTTLDLLLTYADKHLHKPILITNVWGYPQQYIKILKGKYRSTHNYYVNDNIVTDYGSDGKHSGPNTHKKIATDLYNYIIDNRMFGK